MRKARIHIYNPIDGRPYEPPYDVLPENADAAVKSKYEVYKKKISMGIPVRIEYDYISTATGSVIERWVSPEVSACEDKMMGKIDEPYSPMVKTA